MTKTPVALLNHGDFISCGMVVNVARPRTDDMSTPVKTWVVDYVETPDDDAPILHKRFSRDAMVEAW